MKKPKKTKKLRTYEVGVTALAIVYRTINVAASNPEEARKVAIRDTKLIDDGDWTIDDIYNDGKPHCEVAAGDAQLLDDEGYPVDDGEGDDK